MGYDKLPDSDDRKLVKEQYRSVFLKTKQGREVLSHMLIELGVWETTRGKSDHELGRFDYALRLLDMLGILREQNIHKFVENMRSWPTEYPKAEEDEEEAK